MIPENVIKLILAIQENTQSNQATWDKTSREDEYKLNFESGAITTDKWLSDGNRRVDFVIYNKYGEMVDTYILEDGEQNFELLHEIHGMARRSFYKVDETIKGIFNELSAGDRRR